MTNDVKPREFWIEDASFDLNWRKVFVTEYPHNLSLDGSDIHVIEKSAYDALKAQNAELIEALEKSRFALQCMIINRNGAVAAMTDQQVFDGAVDVQNETKTLLAKVRGENG